MVLGALVMVIIAFAYAYMVPQYPKAGGEFTLECFGKVPACICGWFVDMSAIGASIGYLFTCLATHRVLRHDGDGTCLLRVLSLVGTALSLGFVVLQLVPIPGLDGVHFCRQSYVMLGVWTLLGAVFFLKQRRCMGVEQE